MSLLFNWAITVVLFGLAAWLIKGFRLKNGVVSAILGGVVYAVLSAVILRILGLDVDFTRAAALITTAESMAIGKLLTSTPKGSQATINSTTARIGHCNSQIREPTFR